MIIDRARAIRVAEKMAKETGKIHHVIKVCLPQGHDIITDDAIKETGQKSIYKAVP